MFERFTDRARRIVVLAQEEARVLGSTLIGTEHILLGLIAEGEGVAIKALECLGASPDKIRVLIEAKIAQEEQEPIEGHIPFDPSAKRALELALREALELQHTYIGTEHLLLGLMRQGTSSEPENDSLAVKTLRQLGVQRTDVLEKIRLLLGEGDSPASGQREEQETVLLEELPEGHPLPSPELVRRAINAIVRASDEQLEEVLRLLGKG